MKVFEVLRRFAFDYNHFFSEKKKEISLKYRSLVMQQPILTKKLVEKYLKKKLQSKSLANKEVLRRFVFDYNKFFL